MEIDDSVFINKKLTMDWLITDGKQTNILCMYVSQEHEIWETNPCVIAVI